MRKMVPCPRVFVLSTIVVLSIVGWSPSVVRGEAPTVVPIDDSPTATTSERTPSTTDHGYRTKPASVLPFLKICRSAGFDPLQLACTTCSILPETHQSKCMDCCQSYRTLHKRSKRYETAVLLNTGFPEGVQELVRDDTDGIVERKGDARFRVRDFATTGGGDAGMMGMFGMFRTEPSMIMWFDKPMGVDVTEEELIEQADEVTVLSGRGMGRDDIRDMLLALLPDKK